MALDSTWHIRGARTRKDTSYEAATACYSLDCRVFDIDLGTDYPLMNDMALLARALNVNLELNWCILDVLQLLPRRLTQASDDISSRGELEKAPIALYTALWVYATLAGTVLQYHCPPTA
jgi:hypothetical protein